MRLDLMSACYKTENGRAIVYLICRDERGERVIVRDGSHKPYFYIPAERYLRPGRVGIITIKDGYKGIDGRKLKKVIVQHPRYVTKLRGKNCYEAGLLFELRYLIDKNIYCGLKLKGGKINPSETINVPPRVMYIDIEVLDSTDVRNPKAPIISAVVQERSTGRKWAFIWLDDEWKPDKEIARKFEEVFVFHTEPGMLKALIEFIHKQDPDVLAGWYSSGFDWPYLIGRCRMIGVSPAKLSPVGEVYIRRGEHIEAVIKGRQNFDLIRAYRKVAGKDRSGGYSLDEVAQEEFGIGKIPRGSIRELWKNPGKLLEYNLRDVELAARIDEKYGLIDLFDAVRRVAGCMLEDTLYATRMAEVLLHRYAGEYKIPSRRHFKEKYGYSGAYVKMPEPGVYENVATLDLASLYPSIIVSANISPETFREPDSIGTDIALFGCDEFFAFDLRKQGILPRIISRMRAERERVKAKLKDMQPGTDEFNILDKRQTALKVVTNSMYGVVPIFFEPKVAAAVTHMGRMVLHWTINEVEQQGYNVLYADTDSVFVHVDEPREAEALAELVNQSYDDFAEAVGLKEHIFMIEFERLYDRIIFLPARNKAGGAKKRYVGRVVWEGGKRCDYMKYVGVELKRADTAVISKEIQKAAARAILYGGSALDVLRVSYDAKRRVFAGDVDYDELGIPVSISKPLDEYTTNLPQVRGARIANEKLGANIGQGSRVKLLYLKQPNPLGTDVIAFEDADILPTDLPVDFELMFQKVIYAKLEPFLRVVGAVPEEQKTAKKRRNRKRGLNHTNSGRQLTLF